MASGRPSAAYDRVAERRRAVALARHFREAEGLSIAEIAERLGRSPATVKAYFYDPTGDKARAVKARYRGMCRGCGAPTAPRNGKGDAYAYCKRERVREAMRSWRARYGTGPLRLVAHARAPVRRRRAQTTTGRRMARIVHRTDLYGSWTAARADAFGGA
jgi:AraC-like DNA-binding protein